jgi:hypothetical protein
MISINENLFACVFACVTKVKDETKVLSMRIAAFDRSSGFRLTVTRSVLLVVLVPVSTFHVRSRLALCLLDTQQSHAAQESTKLQCQRTHSACSAQQSVSSQSAAERSRDR